MVMLAIITLRRTFYRLVAQNVKGKAQNTKIVRGLGRLMPLSSSPKQSAIDDSHIM